MNEEDAGNRLRALVKAVSDDLWMAAATFEVYAATAFDASLIEKVNEQEIYPAFNVVSEALEAATISAALPHLGQEDEGDAGRITEVEKLLRRRPDLAGDNGALPAMARSVSRWSRSPKSFRRSTRPVRNMPLAHTHDPNRSDPSAAKWPPQGCELEDELLLLEATILVVQQLHSVIRVARLSWTIERNAKLGVLARNHSGTPLAARWL